MLSSISKKRKLRGRNLSVTGAKPGFNWITLTSLFSASVPVLYVIGRAFNDFYLTTYGINPDLFPHSTADYLYMAASGIFVSIIHFFSYMKNEWQSALKLIGVMSLYAVAIGLGDKSEIRKLRHWFVKHTEQSLPKRIVLYSALGPVGAILFFLFCCLIVLLLSIPLAIGQSAGIQLARDEMKLHACSAEAGISGACIDVAKSDKVIFSGRMIAASPTHIAIADGPQVKVFLKDGLGFEVREKEKTISKQ